MIPEHYRSPEPYPVLKIRYANLKNNLQEIKRITSTKKNTSQPKVLIPVKANAYGCGLSTLLPFFQKEQIDSLGVANPGEGRYLRHLGWRGDILNLGGFYHETTSMFFEYDISPSITDIEQVEWLINEASNRKTSIKVHVKLDLGMGRIGIKPEDIDLLIKALQKTAMVQVMGIFTHFAKADDPGFTGNSAILKDFNRIASKLIIDLNLKRENVLLHSANSYAMMNLPESHFDMVRPGLVFYGFFQTLADKTAMQDEFNFKPAFELLARPISLRTLKKGDTVSYGSSYTVKDDILPVGVLPLGYADGLPRALSNNISFENHPLLGKVTMDQIILGNVTTKEPVQILGDDSPPLEYWAEQAGTITYEMLTGLGHRLRRVLYEA